MLSFLSLKRFKLLSAIMAGLFLVVHIALMFIFGRAQVTPMVYVNLCSIAFYSFMFVLIYYNRLHAFVLSTFLEICVHMGLAEYFTGWNSDFQITLIGICILLFYAEYIARTMRISYTPSVLVAPAAVLAYVIPLILNICRPAPYRLPADVEAFFRIAWAVILFGIALPILRFFVIIATRSQEELTNEVLHDKLTGLPNRYAMSDFFGRMSADAHYWIAIADIDSFKAVNDTYGHNCGDYVLRTVASILRSLPSGITVCRWGGEEFLLAGNQDTSDPSAELETFRKAVEAYPFRFEGAALRLTVTVGVAWFTPDLSIDEWIHRADKKLYEGKTGGKNRVVI